MNWSLVGELGEVVREQPEHIARDERNLRRVIPWLFHRNGKTIPYETIRKVWQKATRAAGYPGKLTHDFRTHGGDAPRLDAGNFTFGCDDPARPQDRHHGCTSGNAQALAESRVLKTANAKSEDSR
jgi:hypothetical protein